MLAETPHPALRGIGGTVEPGIAFRPAAIKPATTVGTTAGTGGGIDEDHGSAP
jgi:hypothetical protein